MSLDIRKKEAIHKATISYWEIYNVAESRANRFIVCIVADVWISPLLKWSLTFYAKRTIKDLLEQIQVVCTWHHAIDFMALQDYMQTIHITTDTIPQYIMTLEKAQLQAGSSEIPIPDNYLMMVNTKAMLLSERFPRANEYLEDLEKGSKLWANWCELYNKADMKETIRIQSGGKEAEIFGDAVLGGAGGRNEPPAGRPTPVTVEDLEGCFDSLAGVTVTGKGLL